MTKYDVANFAGAYLDDMEACVERNVDPEVIKSKNHILIMRTVNPNAFRKCMDKLEVSSSGKRHSYVGELSDNRLLRDLGIGYKNLYIHQGQLDLGFAQQLENEIRQEDIDAILFMNYHIYKRNYVNVYDIALKFHNVLNAPVFSYQVNKDTFTYYSDLHSFYRYWNGAEIVLEYCEEKIHKLDVESA